MKGLSRDRKAFFIAIGRFVGLSRNNDSYRPMTQLRPRHIPTVSSSHDGRDGGWISREKHAKDLIGRIGTIHRTSITIESFPTTPTDDNVNLDGRGRSSGRVSGPRPNWVKRRIHAVFI